MTISKSVDTVDPETDDRARETALARLGLDSRTHYEAPSLYGMSRRRNLLGVPRKIEPGSAQ
jgi:hypothetical protein